MNSALKYYRTFARMICTFHREAQAILQRHENILRESGAEYDAEAYAEARDEVISSHRTHTLENLQNCKNYLLRQYSTITSFTHKAEMDLNKSTEEILETHELKAAKEASSE